MYVTARFGGKVVPIYGVDPLNPTFAVHGENRALYARRDPLFGKDYWAELWGGPNNATAAGLSRIEGTLVHFYDTISAIKGSNNLRLQGTLGGDRMTLQLRVWAAMTDAGVAVDSWDLVENLPNLARGTSDPIHVVLGNVSAKGEIFIPPNLAFAFEGFGLYTVPEPSSLALFLLATGALARRCSQKPNRPSTPVQAPSLYA